jgi:selenocysteine lyase/cysteine desulfurase
MTDRRTFIRNIGGLAGGIPLLSLAQPVFAGIPDPDYSMNLLTPPDTGSDEDFWGWVRESYTMSPNIINLNNGGVSPQPKVVQDALERYNRIANEGPSYYMWNTLGDGRESVRMKLADMAGCSPEEIAIDRNTTEAMNTVIFGLNLKAGDEVIVAKQDYPNLLNAWKQREKRDGIKLVWLSFQFPMENENEIVSMYENAITPKTKIIMLMHMINYIGQILPAKKIAQMAHRHGVEVMLDAAHTFAHIDYKIPDLECDYFGTSLHKWLCAPFGTGMLYIKKDKIKNIWALLSDNQPDGENIRKFESLGTRSFPIELSISHAIDFHQVIGIQRKEARLRYLKNYWVEKVNQNPKIRMYTSLKPEFSCGLAAFGIEGIKPGDVTTRLMTKYKIHTTSMVIDNVEAVRITPHIFTTIYELDRLVTGILDIAENGI